MFNSPYTLAFLIGLVFSVLGGTGGTLWYIFDSKNKEITNLKEEVLTKQIEIIKRNAELQKQANEFSLFNSKQKEYEQQLIEKYSFVKSSEPCDAMVIDSLIKKSFSNEK